MFYIDFGGFPSSSLHLDFNTPEQESFFSILLSFMNLTDLKRSREFSTLFFGYLQKLEKKWTRRPSRLKVGPMARLTFLVSYFASFSMHTPLY
jgi:hypothetical protein